MTPLAGMVRFIALAGSITVLSSGSVPGVGAQTVPALESARRLREAGAYSEALDTLEVYLTSHPNDAGARWMMGQLLFWTGDLRSARRAYESASLGISDNPWFLLEYAELLMALGDGRAAREVLRGTPLAGSPEARVEAEALLGTLAYWDWDLPEAVRRFEAVLAENPTHPEARRQLQEIRTHTRPWARSDLELLTDDQPFRRYGFGVQAGGYLDPLWSVAAGGSPRWFDHASAGSAGNAWAEVRGYIPRMKLQLRGRGGGAWQGAVAGRGAAFLGEAEVGIRLPAGAVLRGGLHRNRYLWTRASADTLLMVGAWEIGLDRADADGWAGEAVFRQESFPDGNHVRVAYVWGLVPLPRLLRVGYAFSWSDAEETRWSPKPPPGTPESSEPPIGFDVGKVPGRYDPYHTPEEARSHSLLAEGRAAVGPGILRIDGSLGFHSTERAPVLYSLGEGAPLLYFYDREYIPWRIRGTARTPVTSALTLEAQLEHRETAFYGLTHFRLSGSYRFPGGEEER